MKIQPQWVVTPGKQTNKQATNFYEFKTINILDTEQAK
jgi:hypothetical protein